MKKYLITPEPSYMLLRKYMPDFALFRNKEDEHYAQHAAEFVEMCKPFHNMNCFLHQDYELAHKLGADGVHLTSQQFDAIPLAKDLGLEVVISTHTHDEVHIAEAMGADYITYGPIFETPNKGEPKGVDDLREIISMTDIKVFALGGIISEEQVKALEESGAYGFASIRYFRA